MKQLYHFTSIERWELIEATGHLRTTESNLSATKECAGKNVVWLTTDHDCVHGHGLRNSLDGTDKTRVRIEVALPNNSVHKYQAWAIRNGINPQWMKRLVETAGGGVATWRVTERPITSDRWTEVIDLQTGERLWPRAAGTPAD